MTSFQINLIALDIALTGKPLKECAQNGEAQAMTPEGLVLGGFKGAYLLSGGDLRLVWELLQQRLILIGGDASMTAIGAWCDAHYLVELIQRQVRDTPAARALKIT